jgi:hypothetical protein
MTIADYFVPSGYTLKPNHKLDVDYTLIIYAGILYYTLWMYFD